MAPAKLFVLNILISKFFENKILQSPLLQNPCGTRVSAGSAEKNFTRNPLIRRSDPVSPLSANIYFAGEFHSGMERMERPHRKNTCAASATRILDLRRAPLAMS